MNSALHGQTALITGAAKRIGRAIALALADEGANIIAHYNTSADEANALYGELTERGVECWTIRADFSKPEQYQSLIERAVEIAGGFDILVNSAAVFPSGKLEEITFDDLVSALEINAWAPFVLARSFADRIGRGKIVNLLDTRIGSYDWSHVGYILAKKTLAELTKMMALKFAPDITVNAVAPGLILPPAGQDQSYLDRLTDTVPLKRHGEPEDVARAVVFLVKSDFVTGEVIYVDGGRHLREFGYGSNLDK